MSMDVMSNRLTDNDLIGMAASAVEKCNWIVGEHASEWKSRDDSRTDEQFAELIGLGRSKVNQCRRVWEVFGAEAQCYGRNNDVAWSWWRDLLSSDNAAAVFRWMIEHEASTSEAEAYARMLDGRDLTRPRSDDDQAETCDTIDSIDGFVTGATVGLSGSVVSPITPPNHDPAETAYSPFRSDVGSPPRDRTRQAAEKPRRQQDAEDTCRKLLAKATTLARSVESQCPKHAAIVAEHLDRLAECLRQGETGQNVTGLDSQNIKYLFEQVDQ